MQQACQDALETSTYVGVVAAAPPPGADSTARPLPPDPSPVARHTVPVGTLCYNPLRDSPPRSGEPPRMSETATPADRILVCVAWPYAKTSTHVGQIVGSFLPGDIFARYHRMAGNDVLMVSGSDMHGTPITVDADKAGVTPR